MKKLFPLAAIVLCCACNNSKKEKETRTSDSTNGSGNNTTNSTATTPVPGDAIVNYSIADTAVTASGSVLVQKDKDKLSPGNDLLAIVTANNATNDQSIVVNFLFATKPGVYPVVGLSLTRRDEVYGGILGGETKITKYKLNLTECTDLGSNGVGGHRWRLGGSIDEEITIEAMSIMKMSPGHPDAGRVVPGAQRGRALGFPTLNLGAAPPRKLLPPEGVYAVRVQTPRGPAGGMMNLGARPTFGDAAVTLEAHLFDTSGDFYGAHVRLDLIARIRETRKFESSEQLMKQLQKDEKSARSALTLFGGPGNLTG